MSSTTWTNNGQPSRSQHHNEPIFNTQEVRDTLKQAFKFAEAQEDKVLSYKAASQTNSARSGSAWNGNRASNMGNNKDFFLELRKQVYTMQQADRAGG